MREAHEQCLGVQLPIIPLPYNLKRYSQGVTQEEYEKLKN